MWNTLKTDLQDFVTGVADETKEVTDRLDAAVEKLEVQDELQAHHQAVVMDQETGQALVLEEDVDNMADDELLRRMNQAETYTEPLDETNEAVQAFLEEFELDSYTDQIAQALEEHPDTLKRHFEELVPTQVTYKDFWTRYYYRCDVDRIEQEWQLQQEQAREATKKKIEQGLSGVKHLFGGAVQAVSKKLNVADHTMDEIEQHQQEKSQANVFGSSGRPPFVMNTAMDEDDDDEEEEELGWSDDDESFDDDDDDEEEEDVDTSHEITFSGGQLESLQQELAQALEERDLLHKTVEMQTKEIAAMQGGSPVDRSTEVEELKMALFEKDSEMAALQAKLEDTHLDDKQKEQKPVDTMNVDKVADLEREVERLTVLVAEKDSELNKEKESALEAAQQESEDAQLLEAAEIEKENLETKIESLKASLAESQSRVESLQKTVAETADSSTQVEAAMQANAASQSKIDSLLMEVETKATQLEHASHRVKELEGAVEQANADAEAKEAALKQESARELQQVKAALEQKQADFDVTLKAEITKLEAEHAAALKQKEAEYEAKLKEAHHETDGTSNATPDTTESGVKIASPAASPKNDDDEDDWGDDW